MDQNIKETLFGAILGYQTGTNQSIPAKAVLEPKNQKALDDLIDIFSLEQDFMTKVDALDEMVYANPDFGNIGEFLFDLLMINFFSSDQERYEEDYLESPEWQEIEDETIERGTEMLNLFLYLRECKEEILEPSLTDYLHEFLLVEEDEFQDEHEIYEDVISHQILMESSYSEIARVASQLSENSAMSEVFNPLMGYFLNTKPSLHDIEAFLNQSTHKMFDCTLYFATLFYHEGQSSFPIK